VYAETPRTIHLAGTVGESEVSSLEMYCVQLQKNGQTELLVDVEGVVDCDRAGLQGLLALSGRTGIAVAVKGARWSQFSEMLSQEPIAPVHRRLCRDVRRLVGTTRAPRDRSRRAELEHARPGSSS
jgi:hypothetical protein